MFVYIYLSRLALRGFRSGPGGRGGCAKEMLPFGEGPPCLSCRCFADMGALRISMLKNSIQNRSKRTSKTNKMEPKGNQSEPRIFKHTTCGTGSKSDEQGSVPRTTWNTFFIEIDQNTNQTNIKKRSPKNLTIEAKGVPKWSPNRSPNSSKINIKTGNEPKHESHQKNICSSCVKT